MMKSLSPRHQELARRLMLGKTQKDAASELGISESHACRIIKTPDFQQHLSELNEQADQKVFDAQAFFVKRTERACIYISNLLDDQSVPAATKLCAAREILKWATKPTRQSMDLGPGYETFEDKLEMAELESKLIEQGLLQ